MQTAASCSAAAASPCLPAIPCKRLSNPFRPSASRQLLWPFCSPCRAPSSPLLQRMPYIAAWAPGPLHKERGRERRNVMLTSFSDKDCQESRLRTKGLFLQEAKGERERCPRQREQDASAGSLLSFSAPPITFFRLCGGKDGAVPSAQLIRFRLKSLLPSSPHEPRRREAPHTRALGFGGAICPCSL